MNDVPLTDRDVLYEDNHIIALNKKPGQIVQGDKTGDQPLVENLKKFLKTKYNKPGDVFAGLPHRIDRPVSGVILFAKTSKALSRLNELFRDRGVKKTYWAIVEVKPNPASGKIICYLKKNENKNISVVFQQETNGSLKAELDYHFLKSSDRYHLLEVNPLTGRHHQIRAQLASIGSPIKGDLKYGAARSNPGGSIHLHARKLEFIHPVKKTNSIIEAPVPEEKLWMVFEGLMPE